MKKTRTLLRCLLLLLLVSLGICVFSAAGYNRYLNENFVPNGENGDYAQGVPMERIYRKKLEDRYYRGIFQTLEGPSPNEKATIKEPISLYNSPDEDAGAALVLEPGDYYISRRLCDFGQGSRSLPTYQKGWRYFIPPQKLSGGIPESEYDRWYYVKLEDLQKLRRSQLWNRGTELFRIWLADHPIRTFTVSLFESGQINLTLYHWLKGNFNSLDLLAIDKKMFEKGDYLSPDLLKPLWDWNCTVLAAGIVLLFVLERLLARPQNKTAGKILPSRPLINKGNRGKFVRGRHTL